MNKKKNGRGFWHRGIIAARALAEIVFIVLVCPLTAADAAALPEALGEWQGTPAQVTEFTLSSNGEALGDWQNRIYTRAAPAASVEVNLTEGPGPGALFIPGDIPGDGAPASEPGETSAPSLSGEALDYEILDIAGKPAVLERGEVTGQTLAVSLGGERTLTLETKSISRKELLDFAQKLIAALEGEQL